MLLQERKKEMRHQRNYILETDRALQTRLL
jgi:hypothetical protein